MPRGTRAAARPSGAGDAQGSTTDGSVLLDVRDLVVQFADAAPVVRGLSFDVRAGQTLAIIGESGSGKTVSARALMGLLSPAARVSGSATLAGQQLIGLRERELRRIRGRQIAIVPQDPARSLNPTMKIGRQITEAVRAHHGLRRADARRRAVELLQMVRVAGAERRFSEYPHQLSGGMRQRVVIAIALACRPRVLIADEATTALDVTTQSQIMDLLADLQQQLGMSIILISHDLSLAATCSDTVIVMHAGRVLEAAPTAEIFRHFRSPYTRALMQAIPRLDSAAGPSAPVLPRLQPGRARPAVGCSFAPRCPNAQPHCGEEAPDLREDPAGHQWACWHPVEHAGTVAGGKPAAAQPVPRPAVPGNV
jgi:oligopeptide/dipeptide ABC transporter ATP-binding protein